MERNEHVPESSEEHAARLTRARFLATSGVAVAGAMGLAAPSAMARPSGSEVASADTIRFVNYTNWIGKGEYSQFKTKTGITIHEVPINTDRSQRVAADPSSTDMISDERSSLGVLQAAGLLARLDLSKIPNYKLIGSSFKTGLSGPQQSMAVPTDFGRTGILYRTDLVQEPITSWKDFFAAIQKYPGKGVLPDSQHETLRNALLSMGLNGNTKSQADVKKAAAMLIKLKGDIAQVYSTLDAKGLLNGTVYVAALEDWIGNQTIVQNPNAKLKWVDPTEGAAAYLDCIACLKGSTSKLASMESFINFHLSPKVAGNFSNTVSAAPIEAQAARYVKPAIKGSKITYPPASVLKRLVYWGYLGEAQKYWDDAWSSFKAA